MGRISEKNARYRTREQMAADVAIALGSGLSYGGKFAVASDVMWAWTEFHGKYRGCPYWTTAAMMEERTNPLPFAKKFRHEHAIPKAVLMRMLLKIRKPTEKQIFELLSKLLVGVVVTRAEDNALSLEYSDRVPPEFFDRASPEYCDPWIRYRRCGIEVVQRTGTSATIVTPGTGEK